MKITRADEADQISSFANATIQGTDEVAFSIATYIELPDPSWDVAAVAQHLEQVLGRFEGDGLNFEVRIGHASSSKSNDFEEIVQSEPQSIEDYQRHLINMHDFDEGDQALDPWCEACGEPINSTDPDCIVSEGSCVPNVMDLAAMHTDAHNDNECYPAHGHE